MLVIRFTGKAEQVFTLIKAIAKTRGKDTLGQIIAESEVRSRAIESSELKNK
jgi:hypothetical protein